MKRSTKAITVRDQISEMVKFKEKTLSKHLETKIEMAEKKEKYKEEKWARICSYEEQKIALEEENRNDEITTSEDRFSMMDPDAFDPCKREF